MKFKPCLALVGVCIFLTACHNSSSTTAAPSKIGVVQPKYLTVPNFKSCLGTKTVDTAQFWCLPADKPAQCPQSSWDQLTELSGHDALDPCTASE